MLIGYARVSKADGSQSLDLQRDALVAAGVAAGGAALVDFTEAVVERVDHRSLDAQREAALAEGHELKAEELDRAPEIKLGPAASAIERREMQAAWYEDRDYVAVTERGAAVQAAAALTGRPTAEVAAVWAPVLDDVAAPGPGAAQAGPAPRCGVCSRSRSWSRCSWPSP